MHAAEMIAADIRSAGMPLKAIVPAGTAPTPQDFRLKWQSAMSLTMENPAHQIAAGIPANVKTIVVPGVRNQDGLAGTPKATTTDKAAGSTAESPIAYTPDPKVDRQSKEQSDVIATPAAQPPKQKHGGKAACVLEPARSIKSGENLQPPSCGSATPGPQEIVAAVGTQAIASARPDGNPKSGRTPSLARPGSSPPQAVSQKSGKTQAIPQAIAGGTVAPTSSPRSFLDSTTKHAAPTPAGVHVSVNAPGVASTVTPHASLPALPDAGSRDGLPRLGVRLDRAAATQAIEVGDQHIVAAGPSHLDVGVFDGTHGWLRIRAELDSGGTVNAALTASASAHSSLKSALPEMVSYLNSEAVGVSKIAVHRFDSANSTTAGMNPEGGTGVAHGSHGGRESEPRKPRVGDIESPGSHSEAAMMIGTTWSPVFLAGMTGGWLNVCA